MGRNQKRVKWNRLLLACVLVVTLFTGALPVFAVESDAQQTPVSQAEEVNENTAAEGSDAASTEGDTPADASDAEITPDSVAETPSPEDTTPAEESSGEGSPAAAEETPAAEESPAEGVTVTDAAEEAVPALAEEIEAAEAVGETKKQTVEEGDYFIQSALSKKLVLEAAGGGKGDKVNIQLGEKADVYYQLFRLAETDDGYYTLTNLESNKRLDVQYGRTENKTNVWQYKANKSLAQKWKIVENKDGTLTFLSAASGKALDVNGASTKAGANVQIYKSNKTKAQHWKLVKPGGNFARELALTDAALKSGIYQITSATDPTKGLCIADDNLLDRGNVALANKKNAAGQYFKVTALGKGLYTIVSYLSGRALDLPGAKTENSTNVQQYLSNGTIAQKWYILKDEKSGKLVIRTAKDKRKYLETQWGRLKHGTNVQIYTFNAGKGQFWNFNELNLAKKQNVKVTPAEGVYAIAVAKDGTYVWDTADGALSNGANLRIYRSNNTNAQKFVLQKNEDGSYAIAGLASGRRVAIEGTQKNSANLSQADAVNNASQKWFFYGTGDADGSVYLQSTAGFVADISAGKIVNKQNLQIYSKNKTAAQKFILIPTKTASSGFRTEDGVTKYYRNGKAITGWQTISGKEYYFASNGVMEKSKMVGKKYLGDAGHVTAAIGDFSTTINGQKTLTTYLHNALVPAGRTLYIWGGGWGGDDYNDVSRIGYLPSWADFYKKNAKAGYDYKKYRFAHGKGLDCSGFAGWVLYNTLYTKDGQGWTVWHSTETAPTLIDKKWATGTKNGKYKPGDVVSMNGHVWISLGTSEDGGVLLIHSSPKGVQLAGTSEAAWELAVKYMKKLNKNWPYPIGNVGASYLKGTVQKATWKTSGAGSIMRDPDGIQNMSAEQVMKLLFRE